MESLFINYRRDDSSGYAGRIRDHLASLFGAEAVFIDLDDIRPGINFVHALDDAVAACNVMLVLIGKRWLDARDSSGARRIDGANDFVRIEIAKALERGIRVIPLLVNNAVMPGEKDLPATIAGLANIEAIQLSDERWDYDMGQLVSSLGFAVSANRKRRKQWAGVMALIFLVAAIVTIVMVKLAKPAPEWTGRWKAEVQYDWGDKYSEEFVLRIDAGVPGGTASFLGTKRSIVNGKVTGNQIEFTTITDETSGNETRKTEHHYRGTMNDRGTAKGDDIRFVMQTEGALSDHPPLEFDAARVSGTDTENTR